MTVRFPLYVYVMEVPLSWYEVELDEIVNAAGPTESRFLFKKMCFYHLHIFICHKLYIEYMLISVFCQLFV